MKMKRRIVLVAVLCLAVAALGIGAAPASAADGCDCHTAVPPTGGAPAAHTPFVASVTTCATCHAGWAVPHPTAIEPSLTVRPFWTPQLVGPPPGGHVRGLHSADGAPVVGVVYVQKRFWGDAEFVDVAQGSNVNATATYVTGSILQWPRDRWASFRAVAGGVAGPPVILPAQATWRPKPTMTLKLDGVVNRVVIPLSLVTARGVAKPLKLAGENVDLTVFKLKSGKWVQVKAGEATIGAKGAYKWAFGVRRGSYRMRAAIGATENHRLVRTTWRYFKQN